ncbi:hypothetical protein DXG01_012930, partial [Tephrocybe rancida]
MDRSSGAPFTMSSEARVASWSFLSTIRGCILSDRFGWRAASPAKPRVVAAAARRQFSEASPHIHSEPGSPPASEIWGMVNFLSCSTLRLLDPAKTYNRHTAILPGLASRTELQFQRPPVQSSIPASVPPLSTLTNPRLLGSTGSASAEQSNWVQRSGIPRGNFNEGTADEVALILKALAEPHPDNVKGTSVPSWRSDILKTTRWFEDNGLGPMTEDIVKDPVMRYERLRYEVVRSLNKLLVDLRNPDGRVSEFTRPVDAARFADIVLRCALHVSGEQHFMTFGYSLLEHGLLIEDANTEPLEP